MAKRPFHDNPSYTIFLLVLIVILLGIFGCFMTYKHVEMKRAMYQYVGQAQTYTSIKNENTGAIEEAGVFATTISMSVDGKSLFTTKDALVSYLTTISKQTNRDIVVVNKNEEILADTVPTNIGIKFVEAKNNEVSMTIKDGTPRTFTEKGKDYPDGISQVVVPVKDASGNIQGAVIMSATQISK